MIENYVPAFVLGMLPISEIRGAILYGLGLNLNMYVVFFLGVAGNLLVIPLIFWVLQKARFLEVAKKVFGERIYAKIERNRGRLERWEELALLSFVAIPLPVTGGWTGAFIATLLEMNKKKAFAVISIGIIIAGLITLGVAQGAISGFNILLK